MPTSLVEICRSYGAIRCLHRHVYPEYEGGRRFRNVGRFAAVTEQSAAYIFTSTLNTEVGGASETSVDLPQLRSNPLPTSSRLP